ncbi:MAG: DMT family transporter [Anaerolineae bacterium]|nr:MAG: DMT family transporter [Anaerolineae bacterium]
MKATSRAYLALAGGLLSLGFSAIFVRGAEAPGTVTAFYRMALGAAFMALPFTLHRHNRPAPRRRGILLAALAGAFFGADLTLWATGIVRSGATIPTLMANTAPLWVGLGAWLIFQERLSAGFWAGTVLALLGAGAVLGGDLRAGDIFQNGGSLGLGAAVFYGAYYLVAQRARDHLDTLTFFWISTATSALFLVIVNLLIGHPLVGYPRTTWLIFLASGSLVQIGGWLLINYAQGRLPAPLVSVTLLGQPVLTAVIAWPLFGETLNGAQTLGGAAVLAGVFWVHRAQSQPVGGEPT